MHDFPLYLGMKVKNAPQIAIWVEDLQGNYLSTVYASHKIATQSWKMNGGNPRKEALPHWLYARADGVSGATSKGGIAIKPLADGTSGRFDADMSQMTTALHIIKRITVKFQP